MTVVMGTGSRSLAKEPLDIQNAVLANTRSWLNELHATKVISGMAEGFDACLAMAAIQMDIPFVAAIPSPDYGGYYWRTHSVTGKNRIEQFNWYLRHAYEVVYVCRTHQNGKANLHRNDWMVARADTALVYNPTSRGTAFTVRALDRMNIPWHEVTA